MLKKRTIICCTVMKWLVLAVMGGMALAAVWIAIQPEIVIREMAREFVNISIPIDITLAKRVMLTVLALPVMIIWLGILYYLYSLFDHFSRQAVLSTQSARAVRGAGFLLMVLVVTQVMVAAASSVVLTYDLGTDNRVLNITFTSDHFILLALGFVLCLMGIVMDEALRLSEENRQIV